MRTIAFLPIVLVLVFFLSGCGITSQTPILGKNESDQFDEAPGYWGCGGPSADVKDLKLSSAFLIEDKSTGEFFNKDYVYRGKALSGKSDPDGGDEWILRAKKYKQTYALQFCNNDKREKYKDDRIFYYHYAVKQGEFLNVFDLHEKNLSSEIKDLLGELYINAKDRNDIKLSDDFVASHGKKLIDTIARSLPKADLTDKIARTCKKISGEQARAIIDERLAKAKKEEEAQAAKKREEETPPAQ